MRCLSLLLLFFSIQASAQPWMCRIAKSPDFGRWRGDRPVHVVKANCRFALTELLHSPTITCRDEKTGLGDWALYTRTCFDQVSRKAEFRYAVRTQEGPGQRVVGW